MALPRLRGFAAEFMLSEVEVLGMTSYKQKGRGDRGEFVFGRAVGCDQCNQKGYIGRSVIQELLILTDDIRTMIMQRKDGNSIKREAIKNGMITLREHGAQKVLNGITTIEELVSSTQLDV